MFLVEMHRGTRSSRGAVSWKLILSLLTAISSSVGLAAPLCKLAKVVYKPSAYETAWHSNVDEWSRKDPCSPVPGAAAGAVDCWLRYAAEANNNTGWPRDAGCAGVMSEFEYTYDCSGEGTVKKVDYIEVRRRQGSVLRAAWWRRARWRFWPADRRHDARCPLTSLLPLMASFEPRCLTSVSAAETPSDRLPRTHTPPPPPGPTHHHRRCRRHLLRHLHPPIP